jgi:CBS domain
MMPTRFVLFAVSALLSITIARAVDLDDPGGLPDSTVRTELYRGTDSSSVAWAQIELVDCTDLTRGLDRSLKKRSRAGHALIELRVAEETAMKAKDVMTTSVVCRGAETPVLGIASVLLDRGISVLPVVDHQDRLVGIVSEGDLIRRPESQTLPRRP